MVLEMETGNEPILIHEDRPDMEQVTGGTVTVLHRDGHGTVEPIFSHTLDREEDVGCICKSRTAWFTCSGVLRWRRSGFSFRQMERE